MSLYTVHKAYLEKLQANPMMHRRMGDASSLGEINAEYYTVKRIGEITYNIMLINTNFNSQ